VHYLSAHTWQRWWHMRTTRFVLWHSLHQHNRLLAPAGATARVDTVHDLNFLYLSDTAKRQRHRARTLRRLQRCDQVVAISCYAQHDVAREFVELKLPIEVVYNGVTDLSTAPRTALAGLSTGFLLHVSRMAPNKNVQALIDLAAAWPQRQFVLAGGSGKFTTGLQDQVRQRGLPNVRFRLDIDDTQKAWLYAACDGFLFPSLSEGFGLPPLEAMHFGKPVFLSRLTSLPEVGGDVAHYFDSFEPADMRRTIEVGLTEHTRLDLGARLVAHARRFTWSACADGYVAIYLRCLERLAPR
jgi:glycosyltransferase involved in cell wall biosynthesis